MLEIASEQCPLCGDIMIDEVYRPFIDTEDNIDSKDAESWIIESGAVTTSYPLKNNNNYPKSGSAQPIISNNQNNPFY